VRGRLYVADCLAIVMAGAAPWEDVDALQRLDATRHHCWITAADLTTFDGQEPLIKDLKLAEARLRGARRLRRFAPTVDQKWWRARPGC
jgi:hypothetical protein